MKDLFNILIHLSVQPHQVGLTIQQMTLVKSDVSGYVPNAEYRAGLHLGEAQCES